MRDFEIKVNEQDMALIRRALHALKAVEENAIYGLASVRKLCTELLAKLERQT